MHVGWGMLQWRCWISICFLAARIDRRRTAPGTGCQDITNVRWTISTFQRRMKRWRWCMPEKKGAAGNCGGGGACRPSHREVRCRRLAFRAIFFPALSLFNLAVIYFIKATPMVPGASNSYFEWKYIHMWPYKRGHGLPPLLLFHHICYQSLYVINI